MSSGASIGRQVALYRRALGISSRELGEKSGLSRNTITNLENGRKESVAVDELDAIATALDVPFMWLAFPSGRDGERDGWKESTRLLLAIKSALRTLTEASHVDL